MSSPTPAPLIERLRQRKLVQWAIAYLAGAWVLLQVVGFLADSFEWPKVVPQAATILLGVGLLVVLVLAWFHGERGDQRVGPVELTTLVGLGVVAVGGVAWVMSGSAAEAPAAASALAAPAEQASIAVLPFENLSSSAENSHFADGVMEDVLTNLSQISGLRVISRTSVERYRETTKSLPEIAGELGVEHVLEGSVRRAGDRVRIRAQLSRASTEQPLWAKTFDRELTDIFAVQSEISLEIAEALRMQLSRGEQARLERKPTDDLEAYDLFLRGRELLSRINREDNDRAIRLFQRALEIDPNFHLARALLARAYATRAYRFGLSPEWADSGLAIAERVIAVQPDLPEAHWAKDLSLTTLGHRERAAESTRRFLELSPGSVAAINNMGVYAAWRNDLSGALQWFRRAQRVDPNFFLAGRNAIGDLISLGDLDGAEAAMAEWAKRFPEREDDRLALVAVLAVLRGRPGEVAGLATAAERASRTSDLSTPRMGMALLFAGRPGEAERWLERAVADRTVRTMDYVADAAILLGYLRWQHGDRTGAEALFRSPLSTSESLRRDLLGTAEYKRAAIEAVRGNRVEALHWLERAVRIGWLGAVMAPHDPLFASLRGDPGYESLIAQAKRGVERERAEAERLGP